METFTKDDGTIVSYYPAGTSISIKGVEDEIFTVSDYIVDEDAYFIFYKGILLEDVVVFTHEIEPYYGNVNLDGDGI